MITIKSTKLAVIVGQPSLKNRLSTLLQYNVGGDETYLRGSTTACRYCPLPPRSVLLVWLSALIMLLSAVTYRIGKGHVT